MTRARARPVGFISQRSVACGREATRGGRLTSRKRKRACLLGTAASPRRYCVSTCGCLCATVVPLMYGVAALSQHLPLVTAPCCKDNGASGSAA
jgi:hypothetical protein